MAWTVLLICHSIHQQRLNAGAYLFQHDYRKSALDRVELEIMLQPQRQTIPMVTYTLRACALLLFAFATMLPEIVSAQAPGTSIPQRPRTINRTVPTVAPPSMTLHFSSTPTSAEISRAHVFEEPLVLVGDDPGPVENAALASALVGYSQRSGPDDFSSLTGFLSAHPHSSWQAALLTSLGTEYYNTGHYSKAIEAWKTAWDLSKDADGAKAKAVADLAAGELSYMYARLGRAADLEALLASVDQRTFAGPATERISGAKQGLWAMKNTPEVAFRCGPLALDRIRVAQDPKRAGDPLIVQSKSSPNGFSLDQVADLSAKLGMNYQMAFRGEGAAFVLPSVVHWKVGHYAAMIRKEGQRYLLQDPTFGTDVWVTEEALNAESSGYFLISPGPLPAGWRVVDLREGQTVWGKGQVSSKDKDKTREKDKKKNKDCDGKGMAVANVHLMLVSLNIVDTPVGYSPPVGPPVTFKVTYNQREANQPTTFTYSNLGSKWTFNWLSYIKDNPTNPYANAQYYIESGGALTFTGFDAATQSYAPPSEGQMKLVRTSGTSYELLMPDGSRRIFGQPDGATGSSRKVFLNQILDPVGNAVSLIYDAEFRLIALADAIGQVTNLSYEHPSDRLLITKVTDPFGRFALFDYDGDRRLIQITDTIGLTSQFTYGEGDFISAMTTPYGTTRFVGGDDGNNSWLETTDPSGLTDRVEYFQASNVGIPDTDPAATVPTGWYAATAYLSKRNTYYWSKIAYSGGKVYANAAIYHWLHSTNPNVASGVLESTKLPLENRVWYDYTGRNGSLTMGTSNQPTAIGRVLDDGTSQVQRYQYNALGNKTQETDALGRQTTYVYAANNVDLLEVRQTTAGINELLSSATYNDRHLPLTTTDASGQSTSYTYNARGQLLTATNAKGETTTRTYNADGYLTAIDGPLPGAEDTVRFTYDVVGTIQTVTNVDGYILTYDYDDMDRLTRVTYPDTTFEQFTYTNLDRTVQRDRAGRQTLYSYNGLRQLVSVTDPLNRVVRYDWCKCGDLKRLIDPMGRATTWRHDVQGRKTAKQYADGTTVQYLYENTTSRLKQQIDEKGQIKQYAYNVDDTISGLSYPNAMIPTAAVSYTYDPNYKRMATMADGIGTTAYAYNAITTPATLGEGRLASIDGPWDNDTVSYQYDELGRITSRAIDGVAQTTVFDPAGRTISVINSLGAFAYTYDGSTNRSASVDYPNGQKTEYTYFANIGDHRLQRIRNLNTDQSPLSTFDYTHDNAQRIQTWSQQRQTETPKVSTFAYDSADELTSTVVTQGSAALKSYGYAFDAAGNRTQETIENITTTFGYNALNEMKTSTKPLPDATYEWDAEQRLVAINKEGHRTEIVYDGLGRRAKIVEKSSGLVVDSHCYLWCGWSLCERRDTTGSAVGHRYLQHGFQSLSGAFVGMAFYTCDHLGSVHEITGVDGSIRQVVDYDSWGSAIFGFPAFQTPFTFTGHWNHSASTLAFSPTRAYSTWGARWIGRDPIEEFGGANLFAYVKNNPINYVDPLGLWQFTVFGGFGPGALISFGYNSGQWNMKVQVGEGAGVSASFDPSDSGCKQKGRSWGITAAAAVNLGLGVGFQGQTSMDTSSAGVSTINASLEGNAGAFAGGESWSRTGSSITHSNTTGLSHGGAAVFVGGGPSAIW